MRFTIDASVHLNALNPHEEGTALQSGQGLVAESDSVADEPAGGIEPSPDSEEE